MKTLERLFHPIQNIIPEQLRIALICARVYRQRFGSYPNLIFPRKFSEKVQHRKIFNRDPRLPLRTDKVLVKSFVTDTIGAEYVIPTLWHGMKFPPRDRRPWPLPFVIKANHGSGWNIFVRSKEELDWDDIERRLGTWTMQSYGQDQGEWLYSRIAPQLLVELFIGSGSALPIDYKLWTFDRKVHFIQVDTDREAAHKRIFYDRDWKRLPFSLKYPIDPREIARPKTLEEMIRAAEVLAEDFAYVRVDFYEVEARPFFGELTFYPGGGFERFFPLSLEDAIGALWK